mmetsp:Transcript_6094/g.14152  ORF Transcript_6094/g.14152 Transcript_6094/m.14152 type:complete len:309 (-) Transcript_6094:24-950(-)
MAHEDPRGLDVLLWGLFVTFEAFEGRLHVEAKEVIDFVARLRGQSLGEHGQKAPHALVGILLHVAPVLHLCKSGESLAKRDDKGQRSDGLGGSLKHLRDSLELRSEHSVLVSALCCWSIVALESSSQVGDAAEALHTGVHVAGVPQVLHARRKHLYLLLLEELCLLLWRQVLFENDLLRGLFELSTLGGADQHDLRAWLELLSLLEDVVGVFQHTPWEARVLLAFWRNICFCVDLGLENVHRFIFNLDVVLVLAPLDLDLNHGCQLRYVCTQIVKKRSELSAGEESKHWSVVVDVCTHAAPWAWRQSS